MSESTEITIIVNDELLQFSLWPTHHTLPPGWHLTGLSGTQAAMEELLQHCVATAPETGFPPDTLCSASQWEDTPFGASSQWQDTPFSASL